jgi:hypothetical protein
MRVLRSSILLACAALLRAQAPQAPPPAGLETDWDVSVVLQELSLHGSRLLPVLDRIDAKSWVAKGASETYAVQLASAREQVKAFSDGAKALARNPEKLSASLELLFRIQAVQNILGSLQEGMRKYDTPAAAQQLAALAAENGVNRERFERYIVNLAASREQEFAVMDREAQRCRGIIATQPPPAAPRSSGRKQ